MKNNIKKAPVKFQDDLLYFQHFMLIFCLCPKSVIITTLKARQRAKWAAMQVATMLADYKQIDKRTPMKNHNRSAALGRPAMKLLGGFN